MATSVLIVGGGKVGSYLASLLLEGGHRVRLVEVRPDRAADLQTRLPPGTVVAGSGTEAAILEEAGANVAAVVVAATGADETNLVVMALARFAFRVARTIGKVNDPRNAWMYGSDMGVDVALNQSDLIAHLAAEEMSLGEVTTLLKLRRGQYALVEERVEAGAPAAGRQLHEMALPRRCVIVAVLRSGDLIPARGDTAFLAGDEVLAVVHSSEVGAVAELLSAPR